MQNIFSIVGINNNKATSRLIMVAQEPSLDKINYLRSNFLVPVSSWKKALRSSSPQSKAGSFPASSLL